VSPDLDFRRNPALLTTIVDAMADGLFTVDAKGDFVAWSDGAARITGYTAEDVIGRPCRLLEGPNCKGFSTVAELLAQPDPPDGIGHQECKVLAKDGRELYLHGNVRIVRGDDGAVLGAVGTFADLTESVRANERLTLLEEQARTRESFRGLVGQSAAMQEVFRRLRLAAQSDVSVVLTGESGTGKELAAHAIHDLSARRARPFVALNCGALPETLLESELFGHVKGAFTGAERDKTGVFEAAHGGTLFLDEIGDVSPVIQLKLLRALQEREVQRVGDARPLKVDVRLITATNRDLERLRVAGVLREDFYYRIHVYAIALPPLRERREDIPLLVRAFIEEFARAQRKRVSGIARDALQRLMEHPWPGNVRELRNALEYAVVTAGGDRIGLLDLPPELRRRRNGSAPAGGTPADERERTRLREALKREGGNRTAAARRLGISRVALWKKMKRLGMADAR
jgi:PAS domain S-box-containing protein